MNYLGVVFLSACTCLIFLLPRRLATLPLLLGAVYMTLGQQIQLGPLNFTVLRILIGVGFLRVILRRERLATGINSLDWLILLWSGWAITCSVFHQDPSAAFIFRLGIVYNICGVYFLIRILCQSPEDVVILCRFIAFLLIPLAFEMINEKLTNYNFFSIFGGVSEIPITRMGKIRAQGPFAHSILAGTVGAVCLPIVVVLWKRYRNEALIGMIACLTIVFASSSSGPILSATAGLGALLMWRFRQKIRFLRWFMIVGYIALDLIMRDPAYFIIARIDIAGGSTGWHRSKLIQSAFHHLQEWWFAGTDYTRHWMPTGVSWSTDHSDITNYYLLMGVWGGLPLMALFISLLVKGFSFIGQKLRKLEEQEIDEAFLLWGLGSSLFAHAVTCIGVAYFDQSYLIFYLILAAIGSFYSSKTNLMIIERTEKSHKKY
jgi:hypothetical protein